MFIPRLLANFRGKQVDKDIQDLNVKMFNEHMQNMAEKEIKFS